MRTYYCYPLDRFGKISARLEVEACDPADAIAAGQSLIEADPQTHGFEVWLEQTRVFPSSVRLALPHNQPSYNKCAGGEQSEEGP